MHPARRRADVRSGIRLHGSSRRRCSSCHGSWQAPAYPPGHVAWSATRRRLLDDCERAFYRRYLGARQGWKAPSGMEARRAWTLKHLTALPQLTGTAIHTAARHLLLAHRDGKAPPTQGHAQFLINLLVFGMDVQEAMDAARFRHFSGLSVGIEAAVPDSVRAALTRMGHVVSEGQRGQIGGSQAIIRLRRGYAAGSDPRKDGEAVGW